MKPLEQKISDAVNGIKYAYRGAVLRSQAIINDINLRISGSRHIRSISGAQQQSAADSEEMASVRKGMESNEMNAVEMEDMWLCNRYYRQAVVELSHYLQAYRTKCHKFTEEKNLLGQKIKVLFVATMQLYCHERSRIFLESVDYLKKVKTNMMEWNTQTDLSQHHVMVPRGQGKGGETSDALSSTKGSLEGDGDGAGGGGGTKEEEDQKSTDRTIDAINTTLDALEQTSNAVTLLSSLKLETPLASLPNCSEQILIQSIMQYTPLDMANKILSYMKDDQKKGSGRRPSLLDDASSATASSGDRGEAYVPTLSDFISVKVVATADGILHLFPLEEKKSSARSGDFNKPFKSLKIEVTPPPPPPPLPLLSSR
jgi:hypothetical protein